MACFGKRRKDVTEEVVFALDCHSVIYPQKLIHDVFVGFLSQDRGTVKSRIDVVLFCGHWRRGQMPMGGRGWVFSGEH